MLARAIERCGIATVQLASIRSYVERLRPPRALYCEFPLGRPLGRPRDPEYQRRVLLAALALLEREEPPVLEDFPDRIQDASESPLACDLPPAYDPSVPGPVDESRALRPAYLRQLRRSGRTSVGRAVPAERIPEALAALVRVVGGTPWEEAGLTGSPRQIGLDVRAYYEEAASELADVWGDARQSESWFYRRTEAGRLLIRVQAALRGAGLPEEVWRFMLPSTQATR